jgi:membrane protein implicated in regulation of membrane protease activity
VDSELVWLLVGVGLVVAEVLTLTVVLGLLGVAALTAALVGFLGFPLLVQAIAFTGSSAALLVFVRPAAQRMLAKGDDAGGSRTDARVLTASTGLVVERVSDDAGQVRLNGELWRARPYAGGPPVEAGQPVVVAGVEGATLLVYSAELS